MDKIDIAVIGAGVVGLAVAKKLAEGKNSIVLLEKNSNFGQETSSRNSEVIHSGIHYKPGSLKAKLCVRGNELLYELCREKHISCNKLQKLTVALNEAEIQYLHNLKKQGEENGVKGIKILTESETKKLEPSVKAKAALLTPSTGIIDSHKLMEYFSYEFKNAGGLISYNSEVAGIEKLSDGYKINIGRENYSFIAKKVINCAGLFADRIASIAGLDTAKYGYTQQLCKGEYFGLGKKLAVSRLIYGVPSDALGLGIHLVINLAGEMRLGPNAYFVDRIDYAVDTTHRKEFFDQAKAYFDGLTELDLSPDTSGIRPKLAHPQGYPDFIIEEEKGKGLQGLINLIGIESPGLTSSPAIAEYVSSLIEN